MFANGIQLGSGGATNNAAKSVYQITKTWDSKTVTWSNQPSINNVVIAQSSNTTIKKWEDYDVTSAIKAVIENNTADYGFMLKFPSETQYKGARIYSSEAQDATLRPKLSVSYTLQTTGIGSAQSSDNKLITIKSIGKALFIHVPYLKSYSINIRDVKGRELVSFKTTPGKEWYEIPGVLSSGIHILSLITPEGLIIKKIAPAK